MLWSENPKILPEGVTNRIVLVRHGETAATAQGKCYGKLDVGLSERGREQARRAADLLQQFGLTAICASPRRRASESAEIIAAGCKLPVAINEDFAELDFGDFEGMTYEEVERRHPEIYHKWMTAPTEVQFPNGESFEQMQQRVLRATADLREQHPRESAAIVAHGGTVRIVLANALGMPNANLFRLEINYAGTSVIDFYNEFPVVRAMNYQELFHHKDTEGMQNEKLTNNFAFYVFNF